MRLMQLLTIAIHLNGMRTHAMTIGRRMELMRQKYGRSRLEGFQKAHQRNIEFVGHFLLSPVTSSRNDDAALVVGS